MLYVGPSIMSSLKGVGLKASEVSALRVDPYPLKRGAKGQN